MPEQQFYSVKDLQDKKEENLKKYSKNDNPDMHQQFKEEWDSIIERKKTLRNGIPKEYNSIINEALNNQTIDGVLKLYDGLKRSGTPISPVLQSLINNEVKSKDMGGGFMDREYQDRPLTNEEILAYKNDYIKVLKAIRDSNLQVRHQGDYKNDIYVIRDGGKTYYDNNELSKASYDQKAHSADVSLKKLNGTTSVSPSPTLEPPTPYPSGVAIPPAKVKANIPTPAKTPQVQPSSQSEKNESGKVINPAFSDFINQVNEKTGNKFNPIQLAQLIDEGKREPELLLNLAKLISPDPQKPIPVPPMYAKNQELKVSSDEGKSNAETGEYYSDMIAQEYLGGKSKNYVLRKAQNGGIDFDAYGGRKQLSENIDQYKSFSDTDPRKASVDSFVNAVQKLEGQSLKESSIVYNKKKMDTEVDFGEAGKEVFSEREEGGSFEKKLLQELNTDLWGLTGVIQKYIKRPAEFEKFKKVFPNLVEKSSNEIAYLLLIQRNNISFTDDSVKITLTSYGEESKEKRQGGILLIQRDKVIIKNPEGHSIGEEDGPEYIKSLIEYLHFGESKITLAEEININNSIAKKFDGEGVIDEKLWSMDFDSAERYLNNALEGFNFLDPYKNIKFKTDTLKLSSEGKDFSIEFSPSLKKDNVEFNTLRFHKDNFYLKGIDNNKKQAWIVIGKNFTTAQVKNALENNEIY